MRGLNTEQYEFLNREFGLSKDSISAMDKKAWREVKEKCFQIVVDEIDKAEDVDEPTERWLSAEDIWDLKYQA